MADGWTTVAKLLLASGPFAISRLVVPVVVLAVESVLGSGLGRKVSRKSGEAVPARADGNTTSAVVFVASIFLVVAPPMHEKPRRKEWM